MHGIGVYGLQNLIVKLYREAMRLQDFSKHYTAVSEVFGLVT